MKKVLILIHNMKIGGAQKSLLSFLECLSDTVMKDEYEIHLMIPNPEGQLLAKVPEHVKLVSTPVEYKWLSAPFGAALFLRSFSLKGMLAEFIWMSRKFLGLYPKSWNHSQLMWDCWRPFVRQYPEHYDAVVSYIDGSTNYFAVEKVSADKKTLWIHNEYQKQGYDPSYDKKFFEKCDAIVTISEKCRDCILMDLPQYRDKIHILENITSGQTLHRLSRQFYPEEYRKTKAIKLLSVGRLNPQKGFDMAIQAAKELDASGLDFFWWIVGEGGERERLQEMIIQEDLSGRIQLLGARDNPYPYIRNCDILVQPSRFEGKSIVLDEAKILCKPIVATKYTTVSASVEHGVNGWVVEMNAHGIAEGIQTLCRDSTLRERLVSYLEEQPKGNEDELHKYIELMF